MFVSIHIHQIGKTVDLAVLNISVLTRTFVSMHMLKIAEMALLGLNKPCSSMNIWFIWFFFKGLEDMIFSSYIGRKKFLIP